MKILILYVEKKRFIGPFLDKEATLSDPFLYRS